MSLEVFRPPTRASASRDPAEQRYVTGEDKPSVAQVAVEFGVSEPTAYKWAWAGDWYGKRKAYWASVSKAVIVEVKHEDVERRVKRIRQVAATIDKVLGKLEKDELRAATMTIYELERLVELERRMLAGVDADGERAEPDRAAVEQILRVQVERITRITGEQKDAFNQNQDAALERLGLPSGEARPDSSDGPGQEGQGAVLCREGASEPSR